MKKFSRSYQIIALLLLSLYSVNAQKLSDFTYNQPEGMPEFTNRNSFQFNGYTNYWGNIYKEWYRYGNLFKMSIPDPEKTLAQGRVNIAEDMGLPGLSMQEGFIYHLSSGGYAVLEEPSLQILEEALTRSDVLVLVSPVSGTGKELMSKFRPDTLLKKQLKSNIFNAIDYKEIHAFYLESGKRKIFVVSSEDAAARKHFKELLENSLKIISEYDLHKGWFGAETLLKSVTCTPGHPLEVIGKGLNEGNTWFVFSGYMDFWMDDELKGWIKKTGLPVVAETGFSPIYGCEDYKGLQVQSLKTRQAWIDYAHGKKGYIFRPVNDPEGDPYKYDGYIAIDGNKEQIDGENVPFINTTVNLLGDLIPCMVLFLKKGEKLSHESIWKAIMERRNVGVFGEGLMMGPSLFRNTLQLLLLDRVFPEEYFLDRIDLQADIKDYLLKINISNLYPYPVSGKIEVQLPPEIAADGNVITELSLPANSSREITVRIRPLAAGMDATNPVVVGFLWGDRKKTTMTMLEMPPAISVHRLLYGHAPSVNYPVSIHNFTSANPFPVTVQVFANDRPGKPVFSLTRNCTARLAKSEDMIFDLKIPAGNYTVKVSSQGITTSSQLGVGKAEGKVYVYETDLNSDGINEFRMENDSVQVTLLSTGARVIEYIVKSRNDNILFKSWPEKAIDDKRPFRKRGYYPYGGFEDFLGQASMETHKVYDVRIIHGGGDYVRVVMVADYFGNRLEKTFTLYGNSPLLEVRFALTFINPEANVLGPQPILELGKVHGTEDIFTVPEMEGLREYRMIPEDYYGRVFNLREGWNAGYDSREDITFLGAFPVTQPHFLHMWMNHPKNTDAHHYYAEFQPWVPIFQKSTMYFSYYIWGAGGPWQAALTELRKRNLISTR